MQKNIVILGAGFGGLQAALTLSKKLKKRGLWEKYSVVLIDKNPFHTFTPLLYEIAATSPETASNLNLQDLVSFPIQSLVAYRHVEFRNDCVEGIDWENRKVRLSRSELDFEYLVTALGAEVNYFDIPGLKEHGLPLKTFADALKIRDTIVEIFRNAKRNVRIVVGGGGSTGVELASEIKGWVPELTRECGAKCETEITIVESHTRILFHLDERVADKAERRLARIGVAIVAGAKISRIDGKAVYFTNGEKREFDILIWTGGVKANVATGQLEVAQDTETAMAAGVFAVGDGATLINPATKRPVPGMARPAMMEGRVAAENIFRKILEAENLAAESDGPVYRHREYPYIIPVGNKYAAAKIGPFVVAGLPAWIFKGITELNYFLSIMPPIQAIKIWFRGFLIFVKNDRLG